MAIQFECPHCKTSYEVADDLAGKWIMCRGCQKRGPVRSLTAAKGNPASGVAASLTLPSSNPSRRKALTILAGVLASMGSIATGALLARRPWRHWGESADPSPEATTRTRGGRERGGPPGP